MEAIAVLLLIIFVPLIMITVGLSLINKSATTISEARRDWKNQKVEGFANKFYSKHGVNAAWDLYISEFQKAYGRKPTFHEMKVPGTRGNDVSALLEACRRHGIS
jgi:predicted PurR-regulated permease PerM